MSKTLTRDDFDGGPVSLDEIEPRLWLGNLTAATDRTTIKEKSITHILTVDSFPLPTGTIDNSIINKYVQVSDLAKEDLLSELDECIEFINCALKQKTNSILVHCYFGVSRSAAIVIAYTMKKYSLNYDQAFSRVKEKRRFVLPNAGFIQQLHLFYQMGWCIDIENSIYKMYKLRLAANGIQRDDIQPYDCKGLLQPDPALKSTSNDETTYRCRSCRRILAHQRNLFRHSTCSSHTAATNPYDEHSSVLSDLILDKDNVPKCNQMYFIEPFDWMEGILDSKRGKLHCPKCKTKMGGFSWDVGISCPCGNQVVPAFYAIPSKVEASMNIKR